MKPLNLCHARRSWRLPSAPSRLGRLAAAWALALASAGSLLAAPEVHTLSGGPSQYSPPYYGYVNGDTASFAQFHTPYGLAFDNSGNILFVADRDNNAIRRLDLSANQTTTFGVQSLTNRINQPVAVAVDGANNVYVLNRGNGNNGTILRFNAAGTAVSTNATGLVNATALALDGLTNLYATVQGNTVIRISPAGIQTNVTEITDANTQLQGIAIMDNGVIAVSDAGNHGIWRVDPFTGAWTKLTGFNGAGDQFDVKDFAQFNAPHHLSKAGNGMLVVADRGNHRVKVVDSAGTSANLYGVNSSYWWLGSPQDGIFPGWWDGSVCVEDTWGCPEAREPVGVVVAPNGDVYATEVYYHLIRSVTVTGLLPPGPPGVPGDPGDPDLPLFNGPMGMALNRFNTHLFVADRANHAVRALDLSANETFTFLNAADGLEHPVAVAFDTWDNIYVLNQGPGGNGFISVFDEFGNWWGDLTGLTQPTALTLDGYGNIFVAQQGGAVHVFGLDGSSYTLATVAQPGVQLQGIALFDDGAIAVSDAGNHVIWQINPITKAVALLTGSIGVPGNTQGVTNFARFNQPRQLARAAGNRLVVADSVNNRLVVVQRSGTVTNVPNAASSVVWFGRDGDPVANDSSRWVPLASPVGVAVGTGGTVYSSESLHNNLRGISGTGLSQPPPGPFAVLPYFNQPAGIALNNANSRLYVTDTTNNTVQLLDLGSNETTTFLSAAEGLNRPVAVVVDQSDNLFVLNQGTGGNGSLMEFDRFGNLLATHATGLAFPTALTVDFAGTLFLADQGGLVQRIGAGIVTPVATVAQPGVSLQGIALFDDGVIAVSDAGNHVIWAINLATSDVELLTGTLGVSGTTLGGPTFAKFNQPRQLTRAGGNRLIAADSANNRLVVVERNGAVNTVINPANSTVWFGRPGDPVGTNSVRWVSMMSPVGVVLGTGGNVYSSESLYRDIRRIGGTGLAQPTPPPAVPAPEIGWVDYTIPPAVVVSVLRTGPTFVFNNDVTIAIKGTAGTLTHFTAGPTAELGLIPDPSPTVGTTPPPYRDGMYPEQVPPSIISPQPDVTIKAIGIQPGSPSSAIVQTRFQFKAATPFINGDNAALFKVDSQTFGAEMWYTIDGSEPTNAAPSVGPISGPANISLNITTNTTFKVRAYRNNYQSSEVSTRVFSPTNFNANKISFGFEFGEASSDFVASPGQFFYAPVTLNVLPETRIYSLQFNVTVTDLSGPPVSPGAVGFQSFLQKPIPGITPPVYVTIPPWSYSGYQTDPPPADKLHTFALGTPWFGIPFVDMTFVNTNNNLNLLGVGWLERYSATNLYDTTRQDLIKYSQPHDTLFDEDNGKVVLGGYAFQVPGSAQAGDTYQIQLGLPSATSDGIGAPGSDVYIATPTNGSTAAGALNSFKHVTVGQRKYLAGDSAPFRWFNAGDFGNTNLDNADVMQVFQSAVYRFNMPPPACDFFDAMDSCGSTYSIHPDGYLVADTNITDTAALNGLFNGSDTFINAIAFGDGILDVCDVYVTFRRSLDPTLAGFRRFWTNGVRGAEITGNFAPQPIVLPTVSAAAAVNFSSGDYLASAGQTIQIPVKAKIEGNYPIRTLMLSLSVTPLDGSAALTLPVQFTPNPALGLPTLTSSKGYGSYAATWLNSYIPGLTGNATLGTLTVHVPAGAGSSAAYAVHFEHASASPNGLASFPKQTKTGLITLSDRSDSSWFDAIPDSWRLRHFGSIYNLLSAATADADGDGANNYAEFTAGTNPNDSGSVLRVSSGNQPRTVRWPSVEGKRYAVERSVSLFGGSWSEVSTLDGTGFEMEYQDPGTGGHVHFYRVRVLE